MSLNQIIGQKFTKVQIQIFLNRIVPCCKYCSRNPCLLGNFPKYYRSESLPEYLSNFPFKPSSVDWFHEECLQMNFAQITLYFHILKKTEIFVTKKHAIYVKSLITHNISILFKDLQNCKFYIRIRLSVEQDITTYLNSHLPHFILL